MKYADFKKIENLDLLLLSSLGALNISKHFFELDNFPDFDLSEYEKHSEQTYFFFPKIDFPYKFNAIIDAKIIEERVFHYDDIIRLSEEHNVVFEHDISYASFLSEVYLLDKNVAWEGNEPNFDGFHLNSLRIDNINNIEKLLNFSGGYRADSFAIQPYDWKIIVFCKIVGIPKQSIEKFYLNLIAEGYSLIAEKNYSLAFFILYSAIECYVNFKLNTHDEEKRLSEKIQDLFKSSFPGTNLSKNKIYTSIIGSFSGYTIIRNNIAHGRSSSTISPEEVHNFLLFALTMISATDFCISDFKLLKARIS